MKITKVNRFEHLNVGIVFSFEQHSIRFGKVVSPTFQVEASN